jgi:hypothetical protein
MNEEISVLAKQLGYRPQDMRFFFTRMKILSRQVQLPRPNYYSSKECECCGTYHGTCSLKQQYWTDMEEYDVYPEDQSDFECDGCRQFAAMKVENRPDLESDGCEQCASLTPLYKNGEMTECFIICYDGDPFVFKGQNPKIDCPHFRACRYCQGTGVYANQLFEALGSIELYVRETAEDETDYFALYCAVMYYWRGGKVPKTELECTYDAYISEPKYCQFCHGTRYLDDPIEAVLVSSFTENLMEYGLLEDASQYLAALCIWQNMKHTKRHFTSDFERFEKLGAEL